MKRLFDFLSCVIPMPCPLCETVPDGEFRPNTFCEACLKRLPRVGKTPCPDCGGPHDSFLERCGSCLREPPRPWSEAVSVFSHVEPVRELIHRFKYRNRPELARPFGILAGQRLELLSSAPDVIVPVPLHRIRLFERGYNQSLLLAEVIGEERGIEVADVMVRHDGSFGHQMMRNRSERLKKDKFFSLRDEVQVKDKSVLLIDDVFTTGATLGAATRTLLKAGVSRVAVLSLSRD